MSNITCFIHIYGVNHYLDILDEYIHQGVNFFKACNNIILLCAGCNVQNIFKNSKTVILKKHEELESIKYIHEYSKQHLDDKICYIHTKGVTNDNQCITDWRKYMFYFCCERYIDMLDALKCFDTCGVDLRNEPVKHYSGNFWWANASYLSKLCKPQDTYSPLTERHKAEFWVCGDKDVKSASLHDCGISVYHRHLFRYPEERYKTYEFK